MKTKEKKNMGATIERLDDGPTVLYSHQNAPNRK